ncbi:MAG: putative toxin-antitoxin system toxin component, PIN family [Gallionellales bacterium GWA2_60_142]|nr:MAG: putative toxin-antitoxin system toxin component, PIN family [Gallionellales bacterium GWA2_60_142]HCI12482.1 putative toxin-antitoxin system toxin component, PIN family [Gallionellaceae bacterium]
MSPRGPVVVIDTNVWISGMLTRSGAPAQLIRQVVRQGRPVLTPETFAELKQRLWLPKFDRYVSIEDRRRLLHETDTAALWIDVSPQIAKQAFCRDADDDKFIHAALASNADWLVTGDKDLLVLSETLMASGVRIVSPPDAMQLPEFNLRT